VRAEIVEIVTVSGACSAIRQRHAMRVTRGHLWWRRTELVPLPKLAALTAITAAFRVAVEATTVRFNDAAESMRGFASTCDRIVPAVQKKPAKRYTRVQATGHAFVGGCCFFAASYLWQAICKPEMDLFTVAYCVGMAVLCATYHTYRSIED
jgi:hypothetical protein